MQLNLTGQPVKINEPLRQLVTAQTAKRESIMVTG